MRCFVVASEISDVQLCFFLNPTDFDLNFFSLKEFCVQIVLNFDSGVNMDGASFLKFKNLEVKEEITLKEA